MNNILNRFTSLTAFSIKYIAMYIYYIKYGKPVLQSVHSRKKLTAYRMQSVVTANQATRTNGKKRHVRGHRQPNTVDFICVRIFRSRFRARVLHCCNHFRIPYQEHACAISNLS